MVVCPSCNAESVEFERLRRNNVVEIYHLVADNPMTRKLLSTECFATTGCWTPRQSKLL